jgi:chromosome segregation ATPase
MQQVNEPINMLQQKIQELWLYTQKLTRENQQLKKELQVANAEKAELLTQIEALQQTKTALQIGVNTWNESDKAEFAENINKYLKEIEHWLGVLKSAYMETLITVNAIIAD